MSEKLKHGAFTSEFVTTIIAQLVSTLVVLGVIDPVESVFWIDALTRVLFAVMGLLTTLAYIRGRIELKRTHMQNGAK